MSGENKTINTNDQEEKTRLIEPLLESLQNYTQSRFTLIKLEFIDKLTTVTTNLASGLILWVLLVMFIVFANLALGLYLGQVLGSLSAGFLCVAGFYLILASGYYLFLRNWLKLKIGDAFITKMLN